MIFTLGFSLGLCVGNALGLIVACVIKRIFGIVVHE